MILDSLYYLQMNDRQESVAIAHAATFRWVFTNAANKVAGTRPWTGFVDWLVRSQLENVCWITGKPG